MRGSRVGALVTFIAVSRGLQFLLFATVGSRVIAGTERQFAAHFLSLLLSVPDPGVGREGQSSGVAEPGFAFSCVYSSLGSVGWAAA